MAMVTLGAVTVEGLLAAGLTVLASVVVVLWQREVNRAQWTEQRLENCEKDRAAIMNSWMQDRIALKASELELERLRKLLARRECDSP